MFQLSLLTICRWTDQVLLIQCLRLTVLRSHSDCTAVIGSRAHVALPYTGVPGAGKGLLPNLHFPNPVVLEVQQILKGSSPMES